MSITRTVGGFVLGLALLGGSLAPASAQVAPDKASGFVQDLGTKALTLVEAQQQGLTRAGPGLGDLVRDNFDLDTMGKLTLGAAWQNATPEQVAEYQALFARWMVNSYVLFLPTNRVEFQVVGVHPTGIAHALVDSVISRRGRPPMTATWQVEESGGQMKISDVLVGGVSLVKIKQEEFASARRRQRPHRRSQESGCKPRGAGIAQRRDGRIAGTPITPSPPFREERVGVRWAAPRQRRL